MWPLPSETHTITSTVKYEIQEKHMTEEVLIYYAVQKGMKTARNSK
jgi:hypothetical protein